MKARNFLALELAALILLTPLITWGDVMTFGQISGLPFAVYLIRVSSELFMFFAGTVVLVLLMKMRWVNIEEMRRDDIPYYSEPA